MKKLALLAVGLALAAAALIPQPTWAINCTQTCAGPVGQFCTQQGLLCGQVCAEEGWPCTCGCY